uniref:BPI2 domain-containing protein n=1 Tax=Syphacia muris TaxID=451379 RepID=A0A0N5AET0_9BILA
MIHKCRISDCQGQICKGFWVRGLTAKKPLLQQSDASAFSPDLYGGNVKNPGIKIKLNQKGFARAGKVVGDIVDKEIRTTRLPLLRQCIPQLNGCISVYNMYMTKYRCAQHVIVYPSPPNRINIAVENFDISMAGNLGGQIVVLLPITLSGIVYFSAHQVFVDLITTFKYILLYTSTVASLSIILQIDVVPSPAGKPLVRVSGCSSTVGFVDAYVQNGGLVGDIANNQFRVSLAKVSEKLRQMLPNKLCEVVPQMVNQKLNKQLSEFPSSIEFAKIYALAKGLFGDAPDIPQYLHLKCCYFQCFTPTCQSYLSNHTSPSTSSAHHAAARRVKQSIKSATTRSRRNIEYINVAPRAAPLQNLPVGQAGNGINDITVDDKRCQKCPASAMIKSPVQAARVLMQTFNKNFDRIADVGFSTQIQHTYATANNYTIDINGGFSPPHSVLPFGPFPMYFPSSTSNRMIEILISDFTLNSLLYSMHKKKFFSFRVGPETPKIGPLLRTSCSEDESEEELEDHGVELDDDDTAPSLATTVRTVRRRKRQAESEEESDLVNLGICFGDIVPTVREDHPNKNVYIIVNSVEAPSVIFSDDNSGTAKIETKSEATFFIAETNQKVGAVSIDLNVQVSLHSEGDRIKGNAEISLLKLVDKEQTLGLPQDAMDNLATLGKEMLAKMANETFSKGIKLKLSVPKSLLTAENASFRFVEHAMYIESDVDIPQAILKEYGIRKVCRRRN